MYLYITGVHFQVLGLGDSGSPKMDRAQKLTFLGCWFLVLFPGPQGCVGGWFERAFGDGFRVALRLLDTRSSSKGKSHRNEGLMTPNYSVRDYQKHVKR